jgi:intein/homing endonuclease
MHDFKIPIGPQHPAVDEPSCLRVSLDGNYIVRADLRLGYVHRGIEKLLEGKRIEQGLQIVERICGICLPGSEEIILGNGEIVKLEEFVNQFIPKNNGRLVEIKDASGEVISWKRNSTDLGKVVKVQRMLSPRKLIRIKTRSGSVLHFTPQHKILVDRREGQKLIPCDSLKVGDNLYPPRKINIKPTVYCKIDFIPNYFVAFLPKNYVDVVKNRLKRRYGNLKNASKELKLKYNKISRLGSQKLKIKEIKTLCCSVKIPWNQLKKKIKKVSWHGTTLDLEPPLVDEDFMYLLGLLASDGHIPLWRAKRINRDYRVSFVNKNKILIERFINTHKKVFPNTHVEKPKKLKNDSFIVRASNPLLTYAALKLGIASKSKKPDFKPIFKLPENLISAFLKGYFDGDGTCSIRKGKKTSVSVRFYTNSELVAKRLKQLLQRIGVASSLTNSPSTGFKKGIRYSISITNKLDILTFISKVNSTHPEKRKKLRKIKNFYSTRETFSSFFMRAPKVCGLLFRKLRKKYKVPLEKFNTHKSNILELENGRNALKTTFRKYLKVMEKFVEGNDKTLQELKKLLSNDFFLDPITEIKEVYSNDRYVYDITVKNHHNFIPAGAFVVGNCSVAHPSCYVRVIEKMLNYEPPERVRYLRTLVSELARIQSHLFWAGFMLHELGFETMFAYLLRDREHVLEILERITGNRVHFSYHTIRSVRNDISEGDIRFITEKIKKVEKQIPTYLKTISPLI